MHEELGVKDIKISRIVGQKNGVKKGDRVYFLECEIFEEPKLLEPEKFKEWRWVPTDDLPKNLIDPDDTRFLRRLR